MKPRDHNGVVDSRLNVYGVDGLKVVGTFSYCAGVRTSFSQCHAPTDLSICPGNVAAVSTCLSTSHARR